MWVNCTNYFFYGGGNPALAAGISCKCFLSIQRVQRVSEGGQGVLLASSLATISGTTDLSELLRCFSSVYMTSRLFSHCPHSYVH